MKALSVHSEMGTDLGSIDPIDDDVKRKAQMTVCRYATDVDDAADLIAMLGLDGNDYRPSCNECAAPISRVASDGHHRTTGKGLCITHYRAAQKRAERARKAQTETPSDGELAKARLVDAEPSRQHIVLLTDAGMTFSEISAASDVSIATLRHMYYRNDKQVTDRIFRTTGDKADRVLAIPIPTTEVLL